MYKKILLILVGILLVGSACASDSATQDVIGTILEGAEECNEIKFISDLEDPEIYVDFTQRSWFPNDQTFYTAEEYGTRKINFYGDEFYDFAPRGNYVFSGETLSYYIIVGTPKGKEDIKEVFLTKDKKSIGKCIEIEFPWGGGILLPQYSCIVSDEDYMKLYRCKMIVQEDWVGESEIKINVTYEKEPEEETVWGDILNFNPELGVELDGSISFGSVEAGSSATSNSVKVKNIGDKGVILDMYIAADDYFTSGNELAVCGDGNGIKYDQFSYYATKGSVDSGSNDNMYPGLGEETGICAARADEFTKMPSHSGEIQDMCRIINHLPKGSFLNQGDFMSLTLRLDVPSNCEPYAYTNGQFHVVGRVV